MARILVVDDEREISIASTGKKAQDGTRDEARQRVVSALIALSERLDMRVICEGVETVGERDFLASVGGNWLQGYLYARPGPPVPAVNWG